MLRSKWPLELMKSRTNAAPIAGSKQPSVVYSTGAAGVENQIQITAYPRHTSRTCTEPAIQTSCVGGQLVFWFSIVQNQTDPWYTLLASYFPPILGQTVAAA
jgi:hypothetical protein